MPRTHLRCRTGLLRYGRVTNKAALDADSRKYAQQQREALQQLWSAFAELARDPDAAAADGRLDVRKLLETVKRLGDVVQQCQNSPSQRVGHGATFCMGTDVPEGAVLADAMVWWTAAGLALYF